MRGTSPFVPLLALLVLPGAGQESASAPLVQVGGRAFRSWPDYVGSDVFRALGLRCGSDFEPPPGVELRAPGDCTLSSTSIAPQYDSQGNVLYQIAVVVHVIEHSNGQGQIPDGLIQSQIDVLNEDFRALAGTPGAGGTDARIEFYLATRDPGGNPTSGITRSVNDDWFLDGGEYWTALAWDTTRYLNIYTNNASGYLGYVPGLPQGGAVGQVWDRVVVLWSALGRNAPIGPPYDLGRTATHEVGHYLGLYHTFSGACASASGCYANGDLICDTNPEQSPVFGCPATSVSCGSSDPFHNYMDYSDDACYEEFTPEQVNRMRCTLSQWRPDIHQPRAVCMAAAAVWRNGGTNANVFSASAPVLGQDLILQVASPAYPNAMVVGYAAPGNATLPGGQVLLVDTSSTRLFRRLLALPIGQAVIPIPSDVALCSYTACCQAILFGGGSPFRLTNALDLTPGF